MKRSRIVKVILLSLLVLLLSSQVTVFGATQVDELQMIVRPEYDKAQTVFIWGHGKLAGTSEQKISFVIPKEVDDNSIHICQLDDSGATVKCFLREKDEVPGGYKISAQVTPNFKTEYYYPVNVDGVKKSTSWTYNTEFDVKKLTIQVAEPSDAKDFKVSRKHESITKDDEGFNLHNYSFNNVKAGEKFKFDVSYSRASNEASTEFKGGPASSDQAGGSSNAGTGTIIAAIIAAIAVAGGIVFGIMTAGKKSSESKKIPMPVATKKSKSHFCVHCGSHLGGGKFCPNCGKAI